MERIKLRGHVRVEVWTPGRDVPDAVTEADNVLCWNGLTALVNAVNWSGIEDQNLEMGSPFAPAFLAPMYGAVGTGTTPVDSGDGTLTVEVARGVVTAGGPLGASPSVNPMVTWLFLIAAPLASVDYGLGVGNGWSITEAGVFVQALNLVDDGALLNHVVVYPVSQSITQIVTLTVSIEMGN